MTDASKPRLIVLVGPTAGGKSELAVELALRLQELGCPGQIINADSMQVYRHMDVGTAKPEPELRQKVPHHLIDIVEPTQRFTVADWLALTENLIDQIQQAGHTPIVVGGTNLYIKALLEGMFEGPAHDPALRQRLGSMDNDSLHKWLIRVDPASGQRIHRNDRKKMIRALEVFELTGRPISAMQQQWNSNVQSDGGEEGSETRAAGYRHDPILIGLDWPVEAINRRINARVKMMFFPPGREESNLAPNAPELPEHSMRLSDFPWSDESRHPANQDMKTKAEASRPETLLEEVIRLESAGLLGPQAREALGYKQVLAHLAGRYSLEQAFEQTKILTRRFAKTQRTWLRRYRGVHWLPAGEGNVRNWSAAAWAIITTSR